MSRRCDREGVEWPRGDCDIADDLVGRLWRLTLTLPALWIDDADAARARRCDHARVMGALRPNL